MDDLKTKKIVVILGGWSKERPVSLKTGEAVYGNLKALGLAVEKFDPQTDDLARLKGRFDSAFIALHGNYGEDGCIQGLLELLKIPYTGSGVLSSALCYDKIKTKELVQKQGVLTPRYWVYHQGDAVDAFLQKNEIRVPVIAKPNKEGSSFGAVIIRETPALAKGIKESAQYGTEILIEELIQGKEVTVGLLNGRALPSVEIAPKSGFYNYESKYTAGKTEYFVPARIDKSVEERIKQQSESIVKCLGCRGAPRVDFMLDQHDNPCFLEVNTIPGMTETSLLPKAARAEGLDFGSLCVEILRAAKLDNVDL